MNSEPHIKIIPPNPLTHSILIVYCYVNNKTIQCQAKWTRISSFNSQNFQNRNSRTQLNMQNGNTYRCTSLDFNHIIQVEAICDYMGRQYKLTARTEFVKATKQLIQRKNKQKWVLCKINNSGFEIECRIGLQMNRILQLTCGTRQFNLQLNSSSVIAFSNNSFRAGIHSHRYQFLSFFNECLYNKLKSNTQLPLAGLFQFIFHSQFDRDLTLLKIAENSTINYEQNFQKSFISINDFKSNENLIIDAKLGENNLNIGLKNKIGDNNEQKNQIKTKRSLNQFKKHGSDATKAQNIKNQNFNGFKTPDPKSVNFLQNVPSNLQKTLNNSGRKKNEKIKISQKLIKRVQTQNTQQNQSKSHKQIKIKDQDVLVFNEDHFTPSRDKSKQHHRSNKIEKQCLNIFDDEDQVLEPQRDMLKIENEVVSQGLSKQRPVTNYIQSGGKKESKQDLPSINLRSSFQQLQKIGPASQINSNKKIKQKLKTETNREISYQYPKSRQKTQSQKVVANQPVQNQQTLKQQINDLKRQNHDLRKQLEGMHSIMKENSNLKKKYLQLNEQVNRLELQRKQILADKLKWQSMYLKQKTQKQNLKGELQQMIKIVQNNTYQSQNNHLSPNQTHRSNAYTFSSIQTLNGHIGHQALLNYEENRKKNNLETLNNQNGKRNFLNDFKQKGLQGKTNSNNQSFLQIAKGFQSNSQSRKQLRFPSYSYKYNAKDNAK